MSKLSSLLNELDQKGTNEISARIEATDPIVMGENTNTAPVPNIDKGVILHGGNQDAQVVDKTIKGEDLSGDDLVKYMEETDKKGVITDSKIIENGITDDKGLDAINDYLIGLKKETEHAIETGELKPNQIRETGVVPEEVKEALGVDTNKLNKELQEAREINKPKEPKGKSTYNDLNSVEPINGGEREVVSSSTILPKATPVSTKPLEETKVTRIPLQNTFVADNKKETAKVEVITSVDTGKFKEISISENNINLYQKFNEKRKKRVNKQMLPLPLSNAFVVASPINSNAILEGLQYDENQTEYQNLLNQMQILAEFIELKGVGKLSYLQLIRSISYLEIQTLYLAVFKASTDGILRVDLPCVNPDCVAFGSETLKIPVEVPIDELMHPTNGSDDEFVEHVRNIMEYPNETEMFKHSPSNVVKTIRDKNTGIVYRVGLPTIFDFLTKNLNYRTDENKKFFTVLSVMPFIKSISIPDFETNEIFTINDFDSVFEEMLRNTPQEIFTAISDEITELIKGKTAEFFISKDAIVCPHCGKPYLNNVPVEPMNLLFQVPVIREKGKAE